jgi:hypothetical protein
MLLTKMEIAKRQIDTASNLFLSGGDFLAVITLAGAAEEILGSLIKRSGEKAMIDHLVALDKRLFGGREWSVINSEINGVRNSLKHAKCPKEDTVEIALGNDEAMLSRALANWATLKQPLTGPMEKAHKRLRELNPKR